MGTDPVEPAQRIADVLPTGNRSRSGRCSSALRERREFPDVCGIRTAVGQAAQVVVHREFPPGSIFLCRQKPRRRQMRRPQRARFRAHPGRRALPVRVDLGIGLRIPHVPLSAHAESRPALHLPRLAARRPVPSAVSASAVDAVPGSSLSRLRTGFALIEIGESRVRRLVRFSALGPIVWAERPGRQSA